MIAFSGSANKSDLRDLTIITMAERNKIPRYALIGGREVLLNESIRHAFSDETICVFLDENDERRYVDFNTWLEGTESFKQLSTQEHIVTSESTAREKLVLFKSLFRGREDVYGHAYQRKQGGIGYTPTCAHERTNRCPRWTRKNRGLKCGDCSFREFTQVNDRVLINHFKGERSDYSDVLGFYVLLPDCTTWMLVADFDDEGWQTETALYRDACRHFGLFPAVERSRSGEGAHVWLFFDEPIDADLARDCGSTIITYAMSQGNMSFKAYDRFFPPQSTLPEDGIGNLIALPLQGRARQNSNSVFVDDQFEEYPDQWRFLSSVAKATRQQVQDVVNAAPHGSLGHLAFGHERTHKTSEPKKALTELSSDKAQVIDHNDMPKTVHVAKANMLYISKQGLSPKAMNRIRRLAAFGNPEFYRAQAMHQSVYNKQRVIWCGEENENAIMIPRGCEQKLIQLIRECGSAYVVNDQRNRSDPLKVEFVGILHDKQQQSADKLLQFENGILSAPTGFGKTVIGAYLIAQLKMKTLIIVPKTNLVVQWKSRLEKFLAIEDNRPPLLTKSGKPSKRQRSVIGQIGGGKNAPSGMIDIATFHSLSEKNDLGISQAKSIVSDYDLVICDECQYAASSNLELVLKSVNARRVYGLSATPQRSDGLEGIIYMQIGPIRCRVSPKEQAAEQDFRRILKPRLTRIRLADLEPGSSFNQVVDKLCAHPVRNELIVAETAEAVKSGRTALVITKLKEHAVALSNLLIDAGISTHLLIGEGTNKEKREKIDQVRNSKDPSFAIVATGSYLGEGFDLPQLDTLVLAAPYSWEGVITQYSGRLHREHEGKREVIVYDYVDTTVPMLDRMYKRRLKTYAKLGYEISGADNAQGPCAKIIAHESWQDELFKDISNSSKRIVLSAPYANIKFVKSLVPVIVDAVARGVEARVILRKRKSEISSPLQEDVSKELSAAGCQVSLSESPLTGIALFDDKIVWYGSLPLLAFASSDDCSLRIESAEAASDLSEALNGSL